MDRILVRLIAIVVYSALSACALFSSTEEARPTVTAKAEVNEVEKDRQKLESSNSESKAVADVAITEQKQTKPNGEGDVGLMQARLVARMQEIESELKNQREKIRLLEQGLLTGIAPDDLKHANSIATAKVTPIEDLLLPEQKSNSDILQKPKLDHNDLSKTKSVALGNKMSDAGDGVVQERMAKAKAKYQSGKFVQATADFSSINREFGDNVAQGDVKYWLGKSYMGAKDFAAAKIEYDAYIKGWPSGENIARARIDLAKCLKALGLKERARTELQRVLNDFDGQEVAEIAAYELQTLQGSL